MERTPSSIASRTRSALNGISRTRAPHAAKYGVCDRRCNAGRADLADSLGTEPDRVHARRREQ